MTRGWILMVALAAACTAPAERPAVAPATAHATTHAEPSAEPSAAALFTGVEERMLSATSISGRYAVTADGAFSASLQGTLEMTRGGVAAIDATGTFGEDDVALFLRSDGRIVEGGSAERRFRDDAPGGLTEAVLLGLTRMGILHNLARLTGGAIPDHAAGRVREWVEVHDVEFASDPAMEGLRPGLVALRFAIHVAGQRAAEATLWVDPDLRLPVRREQMVSFPGGRMVVTEEYELVIEE
jgi:hypothetical protein